MYDRLQINNYVFIVIKDVGKEIKSYTELNGRTDSNMIDSLNALYNYDMPKQKLI